VRVLGSRSMRIYPVEVVPVQVPVYKMIDSFLGHHTLRRVGSEEGESPNSQRTDRRQLCRGV
jgi:hypothetical protein